MSFMPYIKENIGSNMSNKDYRTMDNE